MVTDQEQKRLQRLTESVCDDVLSDCEWDPTNRKIVDMGDGEAVIERTILAAIEPYRLALASARNLLEKAPVKDGYLNWRVARAENKVAVDVLLGKTDCTECDIIFPCYGGNKPCIRD